MLHSPKALEQGNLGSPVSIILHIDKNTHTVYGVLSFCCLTCVNHSLSVRKEALTQNLTSRTGSQGNWIPPQTKHSFTRARPATDSNKDDNSTVMLWRMPLSHCTGGTIQPCRKPHHHRAQCLFKAHNAAPTSAYLSFLSRCSHSAERCGLSSSYQWQ